MSANPEYLRGLTDAATMLQNFRHHAESVPMETQHAWWLAWNALAARIDAVRCPACFGSGLVWPDDRSRQVPCTHPGVDRWGCEVEPETGRELAFRFQRDGRVR